jgi:DNA-binding helix-hairpin-helix protein with protein kinase domain
MNSVVTSSGHAIRLGSKLGGGGEGTVYEAFGRADLALKIYLPGLAQQRQQKIQAMIDGHCSAAKCVAFPIETLFDGRGNFVGFAMRRVAGYKPIH